MSTYPDLCTKIRICKKCDLQYSRKKAVCGFGNEQAKVMIIGEAPGAKEDELGKPFVGRSGNLLNKVLNSSGIKSHEIYITNSVKCRPKIGKAPKMTEIKSCSPFLKGEVEIIQPKLIVPMGNYAIRAAGNILKNRFGRITEIHGNIYFNNGTFIVPQFHPAAILRNPKRMEFFKDNFQKMSQLVEDLEKYDIGYILEKYKVKQF